MSTESDLLKNDYRKARDIVAPTRPEPVILAVRPKPRGYVFGKMALDRVLALGMLVLSAPVVLLAVLVVKLTSRGPVLYSQVRLGLEGRPFTLYKIRTMIHNCESWSGPRWSTPGDPRITWVGWFLRRTHLDELPQLWNVLRGEMSLVGPRPERPDFVPQLERVFPCYRDRLLVRPGLTGLAQIQLPADTDLTSVRRKLACDLYYVHCLSWWLDLKILLATTFYLMRIPFAVSRGLFRIPSGKPVEQAYQNIAGVADTVPEMAI